MTPAWRLRAGSTPAHRAAWPPGPRGREDAGLGLPSPVPAEPWSHGTESQPHRCLPPIFLSPHHRSSRLDMGSARRGKRCDLQGLFSPDLLGAYAAHPAWKRRLRLRSCSPSHLVTRCPCTREKVEECAWPGTRAEHHPHEPFSMDQVAFPGCQVSETETQEAQLHWHQRPINSKLFFRRSACLSIGDGN